MLVGWVLFRAETFPQALNFLSWMSGLNRSTPLAQPLARFLSYQMASSVVMGIIFSIPAWPAFKNWLEKISASWSERARLGGLAAGLVAETILLVALLILSAAWLAGGTYNPFIYYRF